MTCTRAPGTGSFLRAAVLTELEDGRISIGGLPAPAVERMSEAPVLQAVQEGLAPYLGRAPMLVLEAGPGSESGTRRVTEEEVRDDTMKALYRQEPRPERAVEELDLELMD